MYERQAHDRLAIMLNQQRQLQLSMPPLNRDPATLEGEERVQFFKDMKLALDAELQEMMDELSWKPWASAEFFNEEAIKSEIIDAWHFLMNLWLAAGGTDGQFFNMYMKKREKNLARQVEGYDGVSTKCPLCKRALDDEHVSCSLPRFTDPNKQIYGWCAQAAKIYYLNDKVTPMKVVFHDN